MTKAHPRPPPCGEGGRAARRRRPPVATNGRRPVRSTPAGRVAACGRQRVRSTAPHGTQARTGRDRRTAARKGRAALLGRRRRIREAATMRRAALLLPRVRPVPPQAGRLVGRSAQSSALAECGNCHRSCPLASYKQPEASREVSKTTAQPVKRNGEPPKERRELPKEPGHEPECERERRIRRMEKKEFLRELHKVPILHARTFLGKLTHHSRPGLPPERSNGPPDLPIKRRIVPCRSSLPKMPTS